MLARNGFLTYATMKNPEKGKNLKSLAEKENSPLRVMPPCVFWKYSKAPSSKMYL
jgi:hypothetical protein